MKILIAEDDAVSRMILHRTLQKAGHEVLAAADGECAWELFKAHPDIDTIVSDWMMPELDGLGLCRRVRNEERPGYTYFIFLTALGNREHVLTGIEAGADDYLSKPLDRGELQMRLISAARVTSLHRQLADKSRQLERLNERLFEQSREDSLTRLGNRLRLREDLEILSARAERYGHGYAVILCDVDHFKSYNDTYGHLAGDDVLKAVATVLAATVRAGDLVYRYGGDEFLAIVPEQSVEFAARMAERLRTSIRAPATHLDGKGPTAAVTISAGIAMFAAGDSRTPDDVLNQADEALYRAKADGRNRVITVR